MRVGTEIIIMFVLTLFYGFLVGIAYAESQEPNCPTEDSCTVDYREGEWHIREVTP